MSLHSWMSTLKTRRAKQAKPRPRNKFRRRLELERLEDRTVPVALFGLRNGGFENGLTSWFPSEGGDFTTPASFGAINPVEGSYFGLIATNASEKNSGGSDTSAFSDPREGSRGATTGTILRQTFFAPANQRISFNYDYLTQEDVNSNYDFAQGQLLGGENQVLATLFPTANSFSVTANSETFTDANDSSWRHTGWKSASVSTGDNAGFLTLQFVVSNTGDEAVVSALAIDNVVMATNTTTSISSSTENSSTYGDSVTFTATVSAGESSIPTGTVTFMEGDSPLGPEMELNDAGQATFTTSTLAATDSEVPHVIQAIYHPTGLFADSIGETNQTVYKAPLFVTPDDRNRTYGAANPELTYNVSGFVNDEDASVLIGSLTTAADAKSDVGTYEITKGTLDATNYDIIVLHSVQQVFATEGNFAEGNFAGGGDSQVGFLYITPAPLAVAAVGTKTYGQNTADYSSSSISGILNGDLITANYASDGENTSASAGTYNITALLSGAKLVLDYTTDDSNLSNAGILTVNQAPTLASITSAPSITYGQDGTVTVTVRSLFAVPTDGISLSVAGASKVTEPNSTTTFADKIYTRTDIFAISGLSAGDHLVSASYHDSDKNFADSVAKPSSLHVDKATASVSLHDLVQTYNGTVLAPTATTPSVPGLKVGFSYVQNAQSVASPIGAGSYDVTATIQDDNYQGSATGTFKIEPAHLIVSANALTKVYGDANPALTYFATGFVNGDKSSLLTGGLTTLADKNSHFGSYDITQGTLAANADYTIFFIDAKLAVTPAPLTVTANDTTRVFGAPNPTFTASYSGFVLGQDASVLSGDLNFQTDAAAVTGIGFKAVVPSGLASSDYAIAFAPGKITITPATSTVALATSDTNALVDQTISFTATVSAVAPGSGTPTGAVSFSVDGVPAGDFSLEDGHATLKISTLTETTHTITASYVGDANFTGDAPVTVTVNVFLKNIKDIKTTTIDAGQTVNIGASASVTGDTNAPAASIDVSLTRDPSSKGTASLSVAVYDNSAGSIGTGTNFVPGTNAGDNSTFKPLASFDVRTNNLIGDKDTATLTFTVPDTGNNQNPLVLKFVNNGGLQIVTDVDMKEVSFASVTVNGVAYFVAKAKLNNTTSSPFLKDLNGTVFTVGVFVAPSVSTASTTVTIRPALALASSSQTSIASDAGSSGLTRSATFVTSTQVTVAVTASQDRQNTGTGGGGGDQDKPAEAQDTPASYESGSEDDDDEMQWMLEELDAFLPRFLHAPVHDSSVAASAHKQNLPDDSFWTAGGSAYLSTLAHFDFQPVVADEIAVAAQDSGEPAQFPVLFNLAAEEIDSGNRPQLALAASMIFLGFREPPTQGKRKNFALFS